MSDQDDKSFDSHLTIRSKDGARGEITNLPAAVLQAIYHEITGKTESLTREFQRNYQITTSDVASLNHRIDQTLAQFDYTKPATNIVVRYQNGNVQRTSSIEKFLQLGNAVTDPTIGVEISFGFLIAVPNVGKLHQYKIDLILTSHIPNNNKDADDDFISVADQPQGLGYGKKTIFFKIDYVDYVVARTFISMIEEWENSLTQIKVPRLPKFYRKYDYQIDQALSTCFLISSAVLCFGLDKFFFQDNSAAIVLLVGLTLAISQGMKAIFDTMVYKTALFGKFLFFKFTQGDDKAREEFEDYINTKLWRPIATLSGLLGTIFVNLIAGGILAWIGK